jgi:hypothetical protein
MTMLLPFSFLTVCLGKLTDRLAVPLYPWGLFASKRYLACRLDYLILSF